MGIGMGRYALIDEATNRVVNVIALEPTSRWRTPAGCYKIPHESANIGDTFDGRAFVAPAPVEPVPDPRVIDFAVVAQVLPADAAAALGRLLGMPEQG